MRRPKPHQVVIVVGVLVALGALASGIIPRITEWDDDSNVTRHAFINVPDPIYWLFYATVAMMLPSRLKPITRALARASPLAFSSRIN